MKYSFKDKIIVITGAANGIGRAASILLANEGAQIIAIDKDRKGLEKLKTKIKKRLISKNINCSDSNEINKNLLKSLKAVFKEVKKIIVKKK